MNVDFIALGASCIYDDFSREILITNMLPMPPGGHCAENIKIAIEQMVNKFKFDKKLIKGKLILLN